MATLTIDVTDELLARYETWSAERGHPPQVWVTVALLEWIDQAEKEQDSVQAWFEANKVKEQVQRALARRAD